MSAELFLSTMLVLEGLRQDKPKCREIAITVKQVKKEKPETWVEETLKKFKEQELKACMKKGYK